MKVVTKLVPADRLQDSLQQWMMDPNHRIGVLTSIDGDQLAVLVLDLLHNSAEVWLSPIEDNHYKSLTLNIPQLHWFERVIWDMFGIVPDNHPRLNPVLLQEAYAPGLYPLRKAPLEASHKQTLEKDFHFLDVRGEGVWQLPVGPIHAGVIEPGHFRFSCMGEVIHNLEIKLGYVHRGVEKRLTEVPWKKAHFVAEAIAGDTTAANALAHAEAIESLCDVTIPARAATLRTIALEIERVAMHTIDVGGIANDIGMVSINASFSKFRGVALDLGDAISGSRFLRSFIIPGGVRGEPRMPVEQMLTNVRKLRKELNKLTDIFLDNPTAVDRCEKIGRLKPALAHEFGMVGVTARACGIKYDTRKHFRQGLYPELDVPIASHPTGDILSRTKVRIDEIFNSLNIIEKLLQELPEGPLSLQLPNQLAKDSVGVGIVEAFRGELIHLIFTDKTGAIQRYSIKDPSWNNWTAISIAIRDSLIADFPLCNKSLALSYSGNDL